jgi:hypothetical protein
MHKDKECKGCKGIENYCALPSLDCPYLKCIVKGICDEHCADSWKYVQKGSWKEGTQIIHKYGEEFWIQRVYLVDMTSVELKLKGKDNDSNN